MGISSGEFYQHFYKDKHLKRYFFIPNRLSSVVRELKIDRQLTSMLTQAHRELGILEGMTKYIAQISPFEDMNTVDVLAKASLVYKHFGLYFIEFLQQQTKQFPKTLILFPNLYIVYLLVLCEVV